MNRDPRHLSQFNPFHIFNCKIPSNSSIKSIDQSGIKSLFLLLSISLTLRCQSRLKFQIQSLFPPLLSWFLQRLQNVKTFNWPLNIFWTLHDMNWEKIFSPLCSILQCFLIELLCIQEYWQEKQLHPLTKGIPRIEEGIDHVSVSQSLASVTVIVELVTSKNPMTSSTKILIPWFCLKCPQIHSQGSPIEQFEQMTRLYVEFKVNGTFNFKWVETSVASSSIY